MAVVLKSLDQDHVALFQSRLKEESFLLNNLPENQDINYFSTVSKDNPIESLASLTNSALTLQTQTHLTKDFLRSVFLSVSKLDTEVNTIKCPSGFTSDAVDVLKTLGIEGNVVDVATLFSHDLKVIYSQKDKNNHLSCRPFESTDIDELYKWLLFELPLSETLKLQAKHHLQRCLDSTKDFRVLCNDGEPVSFGGIDERFNKVVKLGGIVTRPDLRGRGYARQLVEHFLTAARNQGSVQAVLLARTLPAIKCYEGVGFKSLGSYSSIHFSKNTLL